MSESPLLTAFAAAQAVLGARAFTRMSGAFSACRIERAGSPPPDAGTIAAIVPVLDESRRVAGVLTGLIAQGPWLREILVVDGGSADHTLEIVRWFSERDARVRAIEAPARPPGWNGKIWNLQTGLNAADPANAWILTLDADVLPTADLSASLLTFAVDQHLDALSLATKQQLPDPWLGPVHGRCSRPWCTASAPPGGARLPPPTCWPTGSAFSRAGPSWNAREPLRPPPRPAARTSRRRGPSWTPPMRWASMKTTRVIRAWPVCGCTRRPATHGRTGPARCR